MIVWNNFYFLLSMIILLTVFIFLVSKNLIFYAEQLTIITGTSSALIGFILIAIITSIPEMLSTCISAFKGHYGLVSGGIFGSNIANIAILTMIFLYFRKNDFVIEKNAMFNLLNSLFLLSIIAFFMILYPISQIQINKYIVVLFILGLYFMIIYGSYLLDKEENKKKYHEKKDFSLKNIIPLFLLNAVLIIVLSWVLVTFCKQMSVVPIPIYNKTLGEYFIGTLILALATSIPELATTFQMIRLNHLNMAVANMAGSNIFNLVILVVSSMFAKGNFWNFLSLNSLYTIFSIFLVTFLLCIEGLFLKKSLKVTKMIYLIILFIWIYSLFWVF